MERENKSLLHARHNDEAIKYMDRSPDHLDWVVTMCFYSSLHYVRSFLFPVILRTRSGKSYRINHFDEYCGHYKLDGLRLSKHERLLNLVAERCTDIRYEYNRLMDMCLLARYKDYHTDRKMSNMAKSFHKAIKQFCEKGKGV